MSPSEQHQHPVDQALDLLVYLPVGFVFELPRAIPRFIERGRRELHANGRLTDTAALLDPRVGLDRAQAHARGTLRALGVLPRTGRDADAGELSDDEPPASSAPVAPRPSRPAAVSVPPVDVDPVAPDAVDADALAIPGYESLSASQVMPRLESLGPAELELVRRYEHANRGRRTILNKIAQLQAG